MVPAGDIQANRRHRLVRLHNEEAIDGALRHRPVLDGGAPRMGRRRPLAPQKNRLTAARRRTCRRRRDARPAICARTGEIGNERPDGLTAGSFLSAT